MPRIDVDVREDLEVEFRVKGMLLITGSGDCTGALHFMVVCDSHAVSDVAGQVLPGFVGENGRNGIMSRGLRRTFRILFPATVSLADGVAERRIANIGTEMFYRIISALRSGQ